jgi:hypothetical protein
MLGWGLIRGRAGMPRRIARNTQEAASLHAQVAAFLSSIRAA